MSNTKFAILLITVIILIAGGTLFMYEMNKEKYPNYTEYTDNIPVENMEVDSQNIVQNVTIDDVLETRKEILKCQYYDSVFLHMPETPLIAVLMKLGTDVSNAEIAREYLNNKKLYDNVQLGAQIKEMRKKQFEPDSLPKQPKLDTTKLSL